MTLRAKLPGYRGGCLGAFVCAMLACATMSTVKAQGASNFGPQGAETAPDRRQDWRVPSRDSSTASRAILFRPPGEGPFRLALIAHASTQNAIRRAQMMQPDYAALARALVKQGFAVIVPERPGHGATGGPYLEDQGGCESADYLRAASATSGSITMALAFMRRQPFVRRDGTIIVGHSAGGWGALTLASAGNSGISRIVLFAPGRGGHADNVPGQICARENLVRTAGAFGRNARVPVTWLVAENDSYFPPAFSRMMAEAFRIAGGRVDFRVLPPFGSEGHELAEKDEGARVLEEMLRR